MLRRILVPTDGSANSERALPYALAVARRTGGEIDLVHVRGPEEGGGVVTDPAAIAESLRAMAARAGAGETAKASVLHGPVTETILGHARGWGADLVVLTTHGRGPVSRCWIGSVADDLIRSSSVPVLVIRNDPDAAEPPGEPPMTRILIPLDGSARAESIIGPAISLGSARGVSYSLFRVVRPMRALGPDPFCFEVGIVPDEAGLAAAREYLSGVARRVWRGNDAKVETRVDSAGCAARAILDAGQPGRFDVIALSTRGRGGLSRLLLGSVADKVIRGSSVPVLVGRSVDQ